MNIKRKSIRKRNVTCASKGLSIRKSRRNKISASTKSKRVTRCIQSATNPADAERFIHTLIGDVQAELGNEVDSITFDQDAKNIYADVTWMGNTFNYTIPFADLTMSFNSIDKDTSYIVNTVLHDLDNSDGTVMSATYKDTDGIMGERGATWTDAQLKQYWDDNHDSDPVMNEYDSFDSWFKETANWLTPVNASTARRRNRKSRYVKAAESDYIKIGNMVIPKNASGYGYDSFENITRDAKRRYDNEKEEERKAEEKRKADAAQKKLADEGQQLYAGCMSMLDDYDTVSDKMQALFDKLVPRSGKAETLAGELVRAMMRLGYRWYNDGDKFFTGYGLETCGPSAAFIADTFDEAYTHIMSMTDDSGVSNHYEQGLNNLEEMVLNYIIDNPETFWTVPEDSRDYSSRMLDELEEASHCMDFEVDTSGEDLERYIENGCITWDDVYSFVDSLTSFYGGDVHHWAADGFTIVDLTEEQYDEWESMWERELQSWLDELEEEYPNFGMGDEDEDYDDEEY